MDDLLTSVLHTAIRPRSKAETEARKNQLVRAYAALARNHDFRLVMEDMILYVMETPSSDGERNVVNRILRQAQHAAEEMEALERG